MQQQFPRGYFDSNHDYPNDILFPAQPREEFPPPDLEECHKYYTDILTLEGSSVTDTVIVPLKHQPTRRGGSPGVAAVEEGIEEHSHDDEDDEQDIEDDEDDDLIMDEIMMEPHNVPTGISSTHSSLRVAAASTGPAPLQSNSNYSHPSNARHVSPANYAYWLQRELREAIYGSVWQGQILERIPSSDGSLRWKATAQKVAIKIMDFHKVMEQDSHSAERPLQEIAAMQYLQRFLLSGQEQGGGREHLGGNDEQRVGGESVLQDVEEQRRNRERVIEGMMEHHVMTSLDVLSDDTDLYLVMPFCNGGELFDVLEERRAFPETEARFWLKQILRGIETLQRAGVCHRDMSLENILTTNDNLALIIDFGMSIRIPYVNINGVRQRCLIRPDRRCGKVSE